MDKVKTYIENGVEYAEIRNIDWYYLAIRLFYVNYLIKKDLRFGLNPFCATIVTLRETLAVFAPE